MSRLEGGEPGVGVGYRLPLAADILRSLEHLDYLEVIADRYMNSDEARRELEKLASQTVLIPHGVGLSIATEQPLNREYLHQMRLVSEICGADYYSEHLAFTGAAGIDLGHLGPLIYDEASLRSIARRVDQIQTYLGKQLVLENLTHVLTLPGSEMSEFEFLKQLTARTGCGLLLDLTNVYVNHSNNAGFPGDSDLNSYPIENVRQIHLAGGTWQHGVMIDSHSTAVPEPVWALLAQTLDRWSDVVIIVEHDRDFPPFDVLLGQAQRARGLLDAARLRRGQEPTKHVSRT